MAKRTGLGRGIGALIPMQDQIRPARPVDVFFPHAVVEGEEVEVPQDDELLAGGPIRIEDGAVEVSSEPGLGIELDRAALARLHQAYLACGLTRRDDELEMQKVEPGWAFQPTRW